MFTWAFPKSDEIIYKFVDQYNQISKLSEKLNKYEKEAPANNHI